MGLGTCNIVFYIPDDYDPNRYKASSVSISGRKRRDIDSEIDHVGNNVINFEFRVVK